MPPRQHFGMPPGGGGGGGGGGGPPLPPVDDATMHAIMMQRQQTANNSALAEATAEAQGTQGLNEFLKSMAEMQAKSTKSSGEKLAGLA
jgi:3'-phosphoadenosine 5'-phosphosulfate (PAPS) 3'-phosphatase